MPLTRAESKKIKTLHSRKGRRQTGLFLGEGIRLLEEAARFNRKPERLIFSPALASDRGEKLVSRFRRMNVPINEISAGEMGKLSEAESSQGILGVFETPTTDLNELYHPPMRSLLVCDGLSDPGNLGTLFRSALAFAVDLVVLTSHTAEPFAPKVVRSSVGAVFGLAIARATAEELESFMVAHKFKLTVSDLQGTDEFGKIPARTLTGNMMLAVGSEAAGVSDNLANLAAYRVKINHQEVVESLNSAVAGSILLNEWFRHRNRSTK